MVVTNASATARLHGAGRIVEVPNAALLPIVGTARYHAENARRTAAQGLLVVPFVRLRSQASHRAHRQLPTCR